MFKESNTTENKKVKISGKNTIFRPASPLKWHPSPRRAYKSSKWVFSALLHWHYCDLFSVAHTNQSDNTLLIMSMIRVFVEASAFGNALALHVWPSSHYFEWFQEIEKLKSPVKDRWKKEHDSTCACQYVGEQWWADCVIGRVEKVQSGCKVPKLSEAR